MALKAQEKCSFIDVWGAQSSGMSTGVHVAGKDQSTSQERGLSARLHLDSTTQLQTAHFGLQASVATIC